jgi:hypothetical protein
MIEIPERFSYGTILIEGRYYKASTGEKLSKSEYAMIREDLYRWADDQCVDPPKGQKWYDEVYIGHIMLAAHATGELAIEVAKEGYGTDGFNIRAMLIDAGHRDVLDRTLKGQRWLTPDEVRSRLSGV